MPDYGTAIAVILQILQNKRVATATLFVSHYVFRFSLLVLHRLVIDPLSDLYRILPTPIIYFVYYSVKFNSAYNWSASTSVMIRSTMRSFSFGSYSSFRSFLNSLATNCQKSAANLLLNV